LRYSAFGGQFVFVRHPQYCAAIAQGLREQRGIVRLCQPLHLTFSAALHRHARAECELIEPLQASGSTFSYQRAKAWVPDAYFPLQNCIGFPLRQDAPADFCPGWLWPPGFHRAASNFTGSLSISQK